jgi:nitrogenase molybdenum-iron protein beta chain
MGGIIDRPRFGCALGGAMGLLRAIPRAVPILHAPAGCGYSVYIGMNAGAGYYGGGYCGATSTPSSNLVEKEAVFGGEDRLKEQIASTLEIMDGDLYVVLSSCMVEMIGDDIKNAAGGFPGVLATPTPSFLGNSYHGYDLMLETLIRDYVEEQAEKKPRRVNVIGLVPGQDAFYKGNLREIKRLLALIGVDANTLIGEGDTLADIRQAGGSELTLLLSDVYGSLSAEAFKEKHGIPWLRVPLPVGYLQTEKFLLAVGEYFGLDREAIWRALEKENEIYFDYLERVSDSYNDLDFQRYGLVVADANYAPAVTGFIADELGWLPHLTVITDPLTGEQRARLDSRFADFEPGIKPEVRYDCNASAIPHYLADTWERNRNKKYHEALSPLILIGSFFEKELAERLKCSYLPLSFPVNSRVIFNRAYAGLSGGLTLAEDLFGAIIPGR